MKRGDVVTVALPGDYGKPRPAIIVQSDLLFDTDSVVVVPLTTTTRLACAYRPDVLPGEMNGLRESSQAMVEKMSVVPRAKCGRAIGVINRETLDRLSGAMAFALGFLDEA